MKQLTKFSLLFIVVLLISGVSSVVAIKIYQKSQQAEKRNSHEWIHHQIGLTVEEHKNLEPLEKKFHQQCEELQHQLCQGNHALAKAILAQGKNCGEVQTAINNIHHTMGELQCLTICHVFEMKDFLTPQQYDKLLHLTADALTNLDADHDH